MVPLVATLFGAASKENQRESTKSFFWVPDFETIQESMRNEYPVLGVCEHQLMVVTNTSHHLNVGPDERFVARYLQAGSS